MTSNPKRFRIALSFAGERRAFVKEVAALLADRFGEEKILYDKFYEAKFAKAGLAFSLPQFYYEESDLIVTVFCKDYEDKEWCGLEWSAIYGLIKQGKDDQVMLTRFDRVDGKGLYGLAGFVELDDKTPEDAAKLILERLAENEGHPRDHYTKRSSSSVSAPRISIPHNLPTLQPFFGREDELRKIAEAIAPETRGWGALIDGPGGMGKTSLAVRAAYAAPPDDFQRIIFITLKSRELDDDGIRDLSNFLISGLTELLGELARELKRDDILKAADDQRPRLLLSALRGTHTLLVLDNLESLTKPERDVLFTFINKLPVGCKAILTSRQRVGSGAQELILEKLSEEAALATLAELATRNPALAKTSEAERLVLYRETGGKPLLLRWTAGQIGRGHCLNFTDAIAYLRSCPEGNDPLEFIFGDLVEDFSIEETRALSALTYFTLPAKIEHIASLTETDGIAAENEWAAHALGSLSNRSLVVPNDELQTFTLVPLVADFLRRKKPKAVADTGDRLEKRAYTFIIENSYRKYSRFPVLDAAWPSVAAALPRFLAGPNDRLQTVSSALMNFLQFTGRWDEWLALSEQAESKAVAAGDNENAGWRANDIGFVHQLRNQATQVLVCADRAAQHWERAFPADQGTTVGLRERAIAIQLSGIGHRLNENYPAAKTAFSKAVELHRILSDESEDAAIALSNLAETEQLSGDSVAAELYFREAARIARAVADDAVVATCTGNLAEQALARGDWSGAESLAREALTLTEKVGRLEIIASNYGRLARALAQQGAGAEGLYYAQRAVEIFQKLNSPKIGIAMQALKECEDKL